MAELLIDNMRLPKNLYEAHIIIKPNGDVQDYLNGAVFAKAIELPPHGRLIDADKLLAERKKKSHDGWEWEQAYLRSAINSAPTIVEATDG